MNKKREYTHYLYSSEKLDVVFTELYQPKRYGLFFYTPGFELYINDNFLGKKQTGFVFLFFFWTLEITKFKKEEGLTKK